MQKPIINQGIPQQAVPVVNVPNPQQPAYGGPQPNQQPQQPGNQPKQQPTPTTPQSSANSIGFIVVDAVIMDPRGEIPVKRLANAQDASLPLVETDERGRLVIQGPLEGGMDGGNFTR